MDKTHGPQEPQVWVIGGGKGGTGKTFIASSIGIYLSRVRRKNVILVDGDLGGANLHSLVGVKRPEKSLSRFFEEKVPLEELLLETETPNLSLVAGDVQTLSSDAIRYSQKQKLFRHIRKLNAGYVIIDGGGGSHYTILDAFLFADKGVAVLTPDTLAMENLYQFMKNLIFRKIRMSLRASGFKGMAPEVWARKEAREIASIRELLDFFIGLPETGPVIREAFSGFRVHLILNKVRSMEDVSLGVSVKSTFRKHLGIETFYAGFLEYDDAIRKSMREQKPYLLHHEDGRVASEIELLTENLLRENEINLWEE